MPEQKSVMKMPELLVFAKAFSLGIVGAEVVRLSFYAGQSLAHALFHIDGILVLIAMSIAVIICVAYVWKRGVYAAAARLGRSRRIDLLLAVAIGVEANTLIEPWLRSTHDRVLASDPNAPAVVFAMLLLLLLSPVAREFLSGRRKESAQLYFLADDEITSEKEDLFSTETPVEAFAEAVLASKAHAGLVFGIDGPWGIGKTSFINLAEHHWNKTGNNSVVVFRFEPLRYASEPNLAERFIRELSASIQKRVFVPEFRPVASRYSRMLKGKADVSFLGFKVSLEPASETIDELLEDIDDVLKRIGKRLIIIIDDLDRLEASAVNSVLFTVRRTFKLSRATYILCYDTEKLIGGNADREHAREFLEKFITVKLSLFVDSEKIRKFLDLDWSAKHVSHSMVPPERMINLASVLTELSSLLGGEDGASYMSLLGDMRKIKRFVNAALLMRIEQIDLSKTDFNRGDLINLMLLHLSYPEIFRKIYVEETEGRSGMFSVKRNYNVNDLRFENSDAFTKFLDGQTEIPKFLLQRLFHVDKLGLNGRKDVDEAQVRSRACFNDARTRTLEAYLKAIVRFVAPVPQETFVLYRDAVDRVRRGEAVATILEGPDFELRQFGEGPHANFWRLLVNRSYDLSRPAADGAIDSLVKYLPRYSLIGSGDGLRQSSIFSLVLLLDRVGWDDKERQRSSSQAEQVVEIAHRIFGEKTYEGRGLIHALASKERGVAGWNDLMLFRLLCSADRGGQLYNLQSALRLHQDTAAPTSGEVSKLVVEDMRILSQTVFAMFKKEFIDPGLNFLAMVDETSDDVFMGEAGPSLGDSERMSLGSLEDLVAGARTNMKLFVVYQLSNRIPPNGSGVGCGLYDETGSGDSGEIARIMNEYVFGVCFNPDFGDDNIYRFLDYCLANLSSGIFTREDGYAATKSGLPGALDPQRMAVYWETHRALILHRNPTAEDRRVVTASYIASYREDLQSVIAVLDELSAIPV